MKIKRRKKKTGVLDIKKRKSEENPLDGYIPKVIETYSLDVFCAHRVCKTPECQQAVYSVGKKYCFYCEKVEAGLIKREVN